MADPDQSTIVDREPVRVFLGGLAGVVGLGVGAATALGLVDLTVEQASAVVAFVAAVCALVAGTLRRSVYCHDTVASIYGSR